jgi:hypothetical protein
LTSRNLLISSFISSMTHWSLSNVLFCFKLFVCFLLLFLLLISHSEFYWCHHFKNILLIVPFSQLVVCSFLLIMTSSKLLIYYHVHINVFSTVLSELPYS